MTGAKGSMADEQNGGGKTAGAKSAGAKSAGTKSAGTKAADAKAADANAAEPKAGGRRAGEDGTPITIKKYANRRLYNTATSSYVTLDHLCQMVKDGLDFVVYDAKTGEDITRSVLTQIIVEEEAKTDQNLLPISFLRQLITFYGDNMQQMMLPQYLDFSIRSFAENQEKMRDYMSDALGTVFPFNQLEEMGKQNMAIFEQAMKVFSPFKDAGGGEPGADAGDPGEPHTGEPRDESAAGAASSDAEAERIDALQKQMQDMQRQLAEMRKKAK